jgi:hypothetical protein
MLGSFGKSVIRIEIPSELILLRTILRLHKLYGIWQVDRLEPYLRHKIHRWLGNVG